MTKAEKVAKMAELKTEVETKVKEYNAAMLEGKFAEVKTLSDAIDNALGEYTSLARDICFDECAATEDPMMEAVKRLSYKVIGVKDGKVGDDKIPVREVIEKDKQIDLLKLHKHIEGGIGHDKGWNHNVEKLNFLLTLQAATDLGVKTERIKEINDSYAMSELARQIDMGKTPTSKTNILKTLTSVVQSMIGEEYKPVSHDVAFLMKVYSRKSRKALTVTCANHKYMRGYLMEICNRIVTNGTYDIDCKMVRK